MVSRLFRLIAALALVGTAATAGAALQAVEQVYEIGLRGMVLPAGATGRMTVRLCPSCRAETLLVTPETRFFVRPSPQAVPIGALRAAAARALLRGTPYVYVYYEPQGRIARRIVLDTGP